MKKFKKVIDERQEMELYKIEHLAFWVVYWLLLGAIIIQATFMGAPFIEWAFEWFIFMIASVATLIGCYKKGQWDYYTKPTVKTYLFYSLAGSAIFTVVYTIASYFNNDYLKNDLLALFMIALVLFVFLFMIIFALLAAFGLMTKKRQAKLAQEFDEESDDSSR
jgi:membrane protein DedA with SNARE-associated domain